MLLLKFTYVFISLKVGITFLLFHSMRFSEYSDAEYRMFIAEASYLILIES